MNLDINYPGLTLTLAGYKENGDELTPSRTIEITWRQLNNTQPVDYSFTSVDPGTYTITLVEADLPTGWVVSSDNPRPEFHLSGLANQPGQNFGIWQPAAISGIVYQDTNADGIKDATETGIPDITITLADLNNSSLTLSTVPTDITRLTSTLAATNPASFPQSGLALIFTDISGDSCTSNLANHFDTGTAESCDESTSSELVSYSGIDNSNALIITKRGVGSASPVILSAETTTDSDPVTLKYRMTSCWTESCASGTESQASEEITVLSATLTTPVTLTWSAVPGAQAYRIYKDSTSDGLLVRISNDSYQSSFDSLSFTDSGMSTIPSPSYPNSTEASAAKSHVSGSTVLPVPTRTVVTNSTGQYAFANLPQGNYRVLEQDAYGYYSTDDSDEYGGITTGNGLSNVFVRTSANASENSHIDFGDAPRTAQVTGTVFDDVDADGFYDGAPTDGTIQAVQVDLYRGILTSAQIAASSALATYTTWTDGTYSFPGITTGAYTIFENHQASTGLLESGYVSTTPDITYIFVEPGVDSLDHNFGDYIPASGTIAGTVFDDNGAGTGGHEGNGVQDGGEPGLAGVTVELRNDTADNPLAQIPMYFDFSSVTLDGVPTNTAVIADSAFDQANNRIFYSDTANDRILTMYRGTDLLTPTFEKITLPPGSAPQGIALDAANSRLYVAGSGTNSIYVINTNSGVITRTYTVTTAQLQSPSAVALNNDGTRLIITFSGGAGGVRLINTSFAGSFEMSDIYPFENRNAITPTHITYSSGPNRFYVTYDDVDIDVLTVSSNTLTRTLAATAGLTTATTSVSSMVLDDTTDPHVLYALTSKGYVKVVPAYSGSSYGSTYTVTNNSFVLAQSLSGITYDTTTDRIYLADATANRVHVIDATTDLYAYYLGLADSSVPVSIIATPRNRLNNGTSDYHPVYVFATNGNDSLVNVVGNGITKSDADGYYSFTNVPTPANYVVLENDLNGYTSSTPNRIEVALTLGENSLNNDFGDWIPLANTLLAVSKTYDTDYSADINGDPAGEYSHYEMIDSVRTATVYPAGYEPVEPTGTIRYAVKGTNNSSQPTFNFYIRETIPGNIASVDNVRFLVTAAADDPDREFATGDGDTVTWYKTDDSILSSSIVIEDMNDDSIIGNGGDRILWTSLSQGISAEGTVYVGFDATVASSVPAATASITNSNYQIDVSEPDMAPQSGSTVSTPVFAGPVFSGDGNAKEVDVHNNGTYDDFQTSISPAQIVTYLIDYRNNGNQDASVLTILDTVPTNTTYVTGSMTWTHVSGFNAETDQPTYTTVPLTDADDAENNYDTAVSSAKATIASNTITALIKNVPAAVGAEEPVAYNSGFISFQARINSPLNTGAVITNTATLSAPGANNSTVSVINPVASQPILFVDKTNSPADLVIPAGTINYYLRITNMGDMTSYNSQIFDGIPLGTEYVSNSTAMAQGISCLNPTTITANNWAALRDDSEGNAPLAAASDYPIRGYVYDINGTIVGTNSQLLNPGDNICYRFQVTTKPDLAPGYTVTNTALLRGYDDSETWDEDTVMESTDSTVNIIGRPEFNNMSVKSVTFAPLGDVNSDGFYNPGDTVRYTVALKNTGNMSATNVVISDIIPSHLSYETGSITLDGVEMTDDEADDAAVYLSAYREVAVSIATISPDQETEVTFDATINRPTDSGTEIQNIASVTMAEGFAVNIDDNLDGQINEYDSTWDSDLTAAFEVASAPAFDALKQATPTAAAIVLQGDTITYTLTFTNTGDMDGKNVMIADVLDGALVAPPQIPNEGFAAVYRPTSRQIQWNIGSLPVDTSVTVHYSAQVGLHVPDLTRINNFATIYATGAVPTETNTITHIVHPANLVANQKLAQFIYDADQDGKVDPEDLIQYTIRLTNRGNGPATSITISDTLPSTLEMVSSAPAATEASGAQTWDIASLGGFETMDIHVVAQLKASATCGQTIDNEADIAYVGATDDDTITNLTVSAPQQITCETFSAYDLSQSYKTTALATDVDEDGQADSGDTIAYTIHLKNTGNTTAEGVTITDVIPPYTTYVTNTLSDNGSYDSQSQQITWTGISVPTDEIITLSFHVTINAAGVSSDPQNPTFIRNTAIITGADNDKTIVLDPGINAFDNPEYPVFLTSTKTAALASGGDVNADTKINPGDTLLYTISLKNTGSAATDIVIHDTIAPTMTYVTGSITDTTGNAADAPYLTWNIASLPANSTITLTYRAVVGAALANHTELCNAAHINTFSGILSTADAGCTPVVKGASLGAQKTVTNLTRSDATYRIGDRIRYSIVVTNNGTDTSTNVQIDDTVSSNLTYVAGTIAGGDSRDDSASPLLHWTIATLSTGESKTLTFEATIKSGLPGGTVIGNDATGQDQNGNEINAHAPDISIASMPDFGQSVKSANAATVNPNDEFTYTIAIRNSGSLGATSVSLADTIPTNASYVTGSATIDGQAITPDPYAATGNTITIPLGTMAPDATRTLAFRVRAGTNDTTSNQVISNSASISSTEGGTQDTNTVNVTLRGTGISPGTTGNQNIMLTFALTFVALGMLNLTFNFMKHRFSMRK